MSINPAMYNKKDGINLEAIQTEEELTTALTYAKRDGLQIDRQKIVEEFNRIHTENKISTNPGMDDKNIIDLFSQNSITPGGHTGAKIEVHYDELTSIANMFNSEADAITQLYQETKRKVDELAGQGQNAGWIGRGSDAFFAEMNGIVLPSMQRLAQALRTSSSTTQKISQTYRSAEEEARSFFSAQ